MKTKIRAALYALALLSMFVSSGAVAIEPTPVVQAKSTMIPVLCPATAGCTGTDLIEPDPVTGLSRTVEVTGYASIDVYTTGCTSGTVRVYSGMSTTALAKSVYPGSNYVFRGGAGAESFNMPVSSKYIALEIGLAGANCKAWMMGSPFPSALSVRGLQADGHKVENTEDTTLWPLLMGGLYDDNVSTSYIKTVRMTDEGSVAVGGYDAVAGLWRTVPVSAAGLGVVIAGGGGAMTLAPETLVDVTATAMPTAATAKSFTFFNAGPNSVYCGFDNTVTTSTGFPIGSGQGATFDFAAANQQLYCLSTALQVAGAGTRTVLSTVASSMRLYGGGGGGGGGAVTAFAPNRPDTVSLSASTSATKCGLTEGSDYEISCTVPAAWIHGAATPTALLTDNPLPAGGIRTPVRMPTGSTCFAFISSSAGSCTVALLPTE